MHVFIYGLHKDYLSSTLILVPVLGKGHGPLGCEAPAPQCDRYNCRGGYVVPRGTEEGWLVQSDGPQESLIQKTLFDLRLEGGIRLCLVKNIPGWENTRGRAQYIVHLTITHSTVWSNEGCTNKIACVCVCAHAHACVTTTSPSVCVTMHREYLCRMDLEVGKHYIWGSHLWSSSVLLTRSSYT